jgi:hypothetical protein
MDGDPEIHAAIMDCQPAAVKELMPATTRSQRRVRIARLIAIVPRGLMPPRL